MNHFYSAILVILIRQAMLLSTIVCFWVASKTVEYWLFSVENWSNIVSWWWVIVAIPMFILTSIIIYITSEVTLLDTLKSRKSNQDGLP